MKNKIYPILSSCHAIVALSLGLALTLALALLLNQPARAAGVIYVDADAPGPTHDGLSWTTAYTNVQDALAAAVYGDEIWVAEGVYYPDQGAGQTADDRTSTFALKPGVALYGGFAGTETARDQRDWETHVTVLSGDIDGNDVNNDGNHISEVYSDTVGNNAYHVVYSTGVTETARLDGFMVTAGQADGDYYPHNAGGGMYNTDSSPTVDNVAFSGNRSGYYGGGMANGSSNPALINVTFSSNSAALLGGGIYNSESSPMLSNVTFSNNQADDGGGIFNFHSSPTLIGVTFSSNQADHGGGIFNYGSSPTLSNVTFSNNQADYGGGIANYFDSYPTLYNVTFRGNNAITYGGGICNYYSSSTLYNVIFNENSAITYGGGIANLAGNPILDNVTFSGNQATYGGGMYNVSSSPTLNNVTFSGNQANQSGGGIFNDRSNSTLSNCILWGNNAPSGSQIHNYQCTGHMPIVTYSDVQGGYEGEGNIDVDPLFVDAANGNLRLRLGSPAIDAGNNDSATVTTDLDGNPRFVDIPSAPDTGLGTAPIVDMGAYEACVNVSLAKTVSPATALPGETITFTLAFANGGSITATQVIITDHIPAFLSVTSVASSGATITDTGHAQPYVWTVQDLAPGQGGVITLTGQLAAPLADGIYTNTATISADEDAWADNNTSSAGILVNVNDAPAFASTPVTAATQSILYSYAITADDPDLLWGDLLALTAPTLPGWLTLVDHGDGTATLSGTPANAQVGDHAVVLRVTDSGGLTATQSFTIVVTNANDVPTFTSTPIITATQDISYTYTIIANDPDLIHGDVLTLTAPTLPGWLTLTDHGDGTATLSGTPGSADVGDHTVVLRVADSGGLMATQTFTITVAAQQEYRVYLPLVLKNVP